MNTKILFAIAALGTAACVANAHAQSGGGAAGSAGAGAASGAGTGAASGNAGSSSGATTGTGVPGAPASMPAVGSAGGSNIGALPSSAGGDVDLARMQPGRSVFDPANAANDPTGAPGLPTGLSTATARPDVSPISGLPLSEIPAVSPGAAPIVGSPSATTLNTSSSSRPAPSTTEPVAGAAHPATNTEIGMGMTTVVPTPPPAAQNEVLPPPIGDDPDQLWVPGHYTWQGGQWVWVDGSWQRPPTPGAVWVPGQYDRQTHRWTEGHWRPSSLGSTRRSRNTADPTR